MFQHVVEKDSLFTMLVLEKVLSLFVTLMHIPKTIYHLNGRSRDPVKTMPKLEMNPRQERKYFSEKYTTFYCKILNKIVFTNYSIFVLIICHNKFSDQLTLAIPRAN